MTWEENVKNPLILKNYDLFRESGILNFVEALQEDNKAQDSLLEEAYEIIRQESIEEVIDLIIEFLSDKFIPSKLTFILNEGIMVNRIKILSYENMKSVETDAEIRSLEGMERFFRNHSGTTSFLILENELSNSENMDTFRRFNPEIVVPVLGISGLYGVILFAPKVLGEEYSAKEIAYIDRLMHFTSIAIQNTIHYEHSVKDPKTNLYNHNFFIHRVNEQIARSSRIRTPFSIIIMDIDKFKKFNDSYGHLAGDEVIISLAKVLYKTIREGDILSRFGGEEFTVLLPYAGRKEAWLASERFRKAIEDMETDYQGTILKVTVSLGIASYNYLENLDENNLLKRADTALYQSKKTGRNKSSFYKSGLLQHAEGFEKE
ncbi:GGDEF domain-containing protein [Oceanispirochaeta sp. M1]|uniref:GGDEF domain-containing protein n=1 Tax=Oceanispirochaeta sp. M1 TaxID=2283433 RepID=UPI000E09AE35|nr:GGDEF domain-containing protein [Oceanispirochaeta sp. M1]NPD70935.1 GGDEF domain-containing protein [Oceanispirochaeta sp. M1]RDG33769.1 GGDEF domain-containing protein [Oceanispirochaeta sp. M1]